MPKLWNKALRRKVSSKVQCPTSDVEKIRIFRALYIIVYNSDTSIFPLVTELFHLVGDILEGVSPEDLEFRRVDRKRFLKTYEDLNRKES